MNRRILFFLALFLALAGYDAHAQALRNTGASGAQFLNIGAGARAMGMGGAFGSIDGDPVALAWNPAAVGTLTGISIAAEHTAWAAGMSHNFAGVVVPLNEVFQLGFHTIWFSSGDIEITTIDKPEGTGEMYDVFSIAAGLTASVRLTPHLIFATTVKYIEERIYDVSGGTVAADAGMWYDTQFRGLRLGFTVQNLGFGHDFSGKSLDIRYVPPFPAEPQTKAELQTLANSLPLQFRAAGSFDIFSMFAEPLDDQSLRAALDFVQTTDAEERLSMGFEYSWSDVLYLRAGRTFNADELGWNAGAGIAANLTGMRLAVQYAASDLGRFGIGHRIGLSISYR